MREQSVIGARAFSYDFVAPMVPRLPTSVSAESGRASAFDAHDAATLTHSGGSLTRLRHQDWRPPLLSDELDSRSAPRLTHAMTHWMTQ